MANPIDDSFQQSTSSLNNDTPASSSQPKNLIQAISEIQKFYIFEKEADKDIDKSFFTIEQIFNYLKIGFFAGFWESLFFVFVMPLLLNIYPSFKQYFLYQEYTQLEHLIFIFISYASILFITIWLSSLAKYYEGSITKRAILFLISGRAMAFTLKGIVFYYILQYLGRFFIAHPEDTYLFLNEVKSILDWLLPVKYTYTTKDLFYYFMNYVVPSFNEIFFDTLFSMLILGIVPLLSIVFKGLIFRVKTIKNQTEYEKY
jgi:hypothetical protein